MNNTTETTINFSFIEILNIGSNLYFFIALAAIVFATIYTNIFIIALVFARKSMRTYTNAQFTSMAVADLLVGCIAMPSLLIDTMYGYWPLNRFFCILWCICDFAGTNVSSLNLVAVSVYQLRCIKTPFKATSKTLKIETLAMILTWAVPFVFWVSSILLVIFLTNTMKPDECYFMYTKEYVMVANALFYLSPAVTLVVLQGLIYMALKQQSNKIIPAADNNTLFTKRKNSTLNLNTTNLNTTNLKTTMRLDESHDSGESKPENTVNTVENLKADKKSKKKTLAKEQKAFRVLLFVSLTYLALWMPWITIWPIEAYCECVPDWYYQTTYWMQYANSLVNPLFLIIRHSKFRKPFLDTFKCKFTDK